MPSTAHTPCRKHASLEVILVAQPQSASKLQESKHMPASGVISKVQHDNTKLITCPSSEDCGEEKFPHTDSDIQNNEEIFDFEC
jgi:uncharacterized protein (UPF0179 family)